MNLGYPLLITAFMVVTIAYTHSNLEYKGYPRTSSCTGECYEQHVAEFGTVVEQLKAKQALAATDEFSSIRSLWSGCAACHGQQGEGMAVFPKLAGQSADYIADRLNTYKARGQVGGMSSTMWSQAALLSEKDIQTLGEFIATELK